MKESALETGPTPSVVVELHGRLYVRGWENTEVRVRGDDESLSLKEEGDQILVHCRASTDLRVPNGAHITVKSAHGEATIKGISGSITNEQIGGSIALKDTGPAHIHFTGGDLNAANVQGDLIAEQVGRFANVKDIQGAFRADMIGSHLNLKRVEGDIQAKANGNANLGLDLRPGQRCAIRANGVITCRIPTHFSGHVTIKSHGPITVRVGEERQTVLGGSYEHTFGDGNATLELDANGPVSLVASAPSDRPVDEFDFDFDIDADIGAGVGDLPNDLSRQITEQVVSQLDLLGHKLDASTEGLSAMLDSAGLSEEKADRIRKRTEEKMAKAQAKIQHAQERAARKIAQAQRKAARKARTSEGRTKWDFQRSWSNRGGAEKEKPDPVSDEERMMILNMVAEGKIGIEEAESLLAALEGK